MTSPGCLLNREAGGSRIKRPAIRPGKDPWNRKNLIDDPALTDIRAALRAELEGWMMALGDEGQATELRAHKHLAKR